MAPLREICAKLIVTSLHCSRVSEYVRELFVAPLISLGGGVELLVKFNYWFLAQERNQMWLERILQLAVKCVTY